MSPCNLSLGPLEHLLSRCSFLGHSVSEASCHVLRSYMEKPHKYSGQQSLLELILQPPQLRCQKENEETILVSWYNLVGSPAPVVLASSYFEMLLAIQVVQLKPHILESRDLPTAPFLNV